MNKHEEKFIQTVRAYYAKEGRSTLPWRKTRDPYRILVSEIMLQQTQVDRVIPKYAVFLEKFPTVDTLAKASLGDVLRMWQGLGYNRRAKMLHECAREVVTVYGGVLPKDSTLLQTLPGIGPYTAGAVAAFAFNAGTPLIETNIRSVYLHHFFSDATDVPDSQLLQLIERTLDRKKPREWYYALMDYGSYIKKEYGNPNSRSKQYVKQSAFKGSDRQIRGVILRALTHAPQTREELLRLAFEDIRVDAQVAKLAQEGLVVLQRGKYRLP